MKALTHAYILKQHSCFYSSRCPLINKRFQKVGWFDRLPGQHPRPRQEGAAGAELFPWLGPLGLGFKLHRVVVIVCTQSFVYILWTN